MNVPRRESSLSIPFSRAWWMGALAIMLVLMSMIGEASGQTIQADGRQVWMGDWRIDEVGFETSVKRLDTRVPPTAGWGRPAIAAGDRHAAAVRWHWEWQRAARSRRVVRPAMWVGFERRAVAAPVDINTGTR